MNVKSYPRREGVEYLREDGYPKFQPQQKKSHFLTKWFFLCKKIKLFRLYSMDYFITTSATHNLRFIHRIFEPIVTITIYHELTNTKSVLSNLECELVDGYSLIEFDYNFILNGTYTLEIIGNEELIYRSKAKAI